MTTDPESTINAPKFDSVKFLTEIQDAIHVLNTVCTRHNVPLPDALVIDDPSKFSKFITTLRHAMATAGDKIPSMHEVDRVAHIEIRRGTQKVGHI